MVIFLVALLLILIASFFWAFKSMKSYIESPQDLAKNYSLYLIQNPANLTNETLSQILGKTVKEKLIISFEKLFKGSRSAKVLYGPKNIMEDFITRLGLIELEDYSHTLASEDVKEGKVILYQLGLKSAGNFQESVDFSGVDLKEEEQFWWQCVVQPQFSASLWDLFFPKPKEHKFQVIIRAMIKAPDHQRVKFLQESFKIGENLHLSTLPQAYSKEQMVKFYQMRSITPKNLTNPRGVPVVVSGEELKNLL